MIKLIVTDMDGTLLDENKHLTSRFFPVLKELRKRGVYFAVASGRQPADLRLTFGECADDVIYIGGNGGLICRGTETEYVAEFDREILTGIVQHCRRLPEARVGLCGTKNIYIDNEDGWFRYIVDRYFQNVGVLDDVLKAFDMDQIYKISINTEIEPEINTYGQMMEYSDYCDLLLSGEHWLDLLKKGENKGSAIARLQKMLGVTFEETAIFGDYLNDMPMMHSGYYSYAMKNAHPDIKREARFETRYTNEEEGVVETLIELFGLQGRGL